MSKKSDPADNLPSYSDEDFEKKSRELWDGYRDLYRESLRNPSYNKVRRLVHDMMRLVESVASPMNSPDEDTVAGYPDPCIGSMQSRDERDALLREFAATRYMWPCVVEIHKDMSGMTFPRSKNNDSGLEQFLSEINLGSDLPGKQTGYKKTSGTGFIRDGVPTFPGFVRSEIETVMLRVKDAEGKRGSGSLPEWLEEAMSTEDLGIDTMDAWCDLLVAKIKAEHDGKLENCGELLQHLTDGYDKWNNSQGGGTFDAFSRKEFKRVIKKFWA